MRASTSQNKLPDSSHGNAEGSLWTDILNSVTESRAVVVKQLVVLGSVKTGKSTLVERLNPAGATTMTGHGPPAPLMARSSSAQAAASSSTSTFTQDLGLGYSCFDIRDEDQDVVARLGTYEASSFDQARAVLPLVLNANTLLDTAVVVCLDWERPWLFMRQLEGWMRVLKGVLDKIDSSEQAKRARERLEASLKRLSTEASLSTVSADAANDLPLPEGVLQDNLGVPLVVVCTKADYVAVLERDTLYKDEHFDNIQQVLRTIALHYGSAAFYTSISRPDSFEKLRRYVFYKLFGESSSSSSARTLFAFKERANVVDRDQLVVPAGWDSWGKIKLTRESFDPSVIIRAWEADFATTTDDDSHETRQVGAVRMYEGAIPDAHAHKRIARPNKGGANVIFAQPEQEFLKAQYDILLKEREKDPRAAFASRPDSTTSAPSSLFAAPPVVGPMNASSSLRMPNVEKAFGHSAAPVDSAASTGTTATTARRAQSSTTTATAIEASSGTTTGRLPSSLLSGNAGSGQAAAAAAAGGGGAQNEVLANFFQSLLEKRSTVPSSSSRDSPAR